MIQPETWKTIGGGLEHTWNVTGPLVGVVIGALLARSWDRRKWLDDNRASESRELLRIFTLTIHHLFSAQHSLEANLSTQFAAERELANDTYNESLRVLQDRIFVAKDVKQHKLRERWVQANTDYRLRQDGPKFQADYEGIQETILEMVLGKR
ncbi:MAG: hypothetical protein WA871_10330 [Candidatus Acidiferrales bacterium]